MKPNYDMPVISIDFDGCIVEDKWPEIGDEITGAVETINGWYDDGYWIIINSCRQYDDLETMIGYLNYADIKFHEINKNLDWRIAKYGTDPRKIGADIYIDDHNIGFAGHKITQAIWQNFRIWVERYTIQRLNNERQ